jgi:hypothetical protein
MRLEKTAILRYYKYYALSNNVKVIGRPNVGAFSSNELKFDWRILRWYLVREKWDL